jgi:plasmid stability protein
VSAVLGSRNHLSSNFPQAENQIHGILAVMKTTLDLPDDLMREVKIRAVKENRKLKDEIADLLRHGLSRRSAEPRAVGQRVQLPLVECSHEARPGEELTPERVADVLLEQESEAQRGSLR